MPVFTFTGFWLYTDSMETILVVEDDRNLRQTLAYNLEREGFRTLSAEDGREAIAIARREKPGLIILDLMLPEINGLDVCRILRKEMTVPVIMLTARAGEADKITGLETGADDYVTKPFSMKELMARVHAMLRRAAIVPSLNSFTAAIEISNIVIDPARHTVHRDGEPLELTPKEFDLLSFLAASRGIVFTREQLLDKVWGYDYAGDTRTVDVHVRWLRQKIEADPHTPRLLLTVRGTGYKLEG